MKRFTYLIMPVLMLTACSTYRYPEPVNPTKEFYQAKALCQRTTPIHRETPGWAYIEDEREYFLTCMKGAGF